MKKIVSTVFVLALLSFLAFAAKPTINSTHHQPMVLSGEYDPFVVLELYTSQGCSSCPAADRLLRQIKTSGQENVITLSYHVDYWNYIGWEDPYSSSNFTRKQSLYNRKFNSRTNYTPQLVINGREHLVGSDKSRIFPRIKHYSQLKTVNTIELSDVIQSENNLRFKYTVSGELGEKNIRALLVLDERETLVKRGENSNKKLINSSIVVLEQIAVLNSDTGILSLKVPGHIANEELLHLVVLIENQNYDITAAGKVTL